MLRKWIKRWVLKRQYMVIGWLVRPIVNSMSLSGISFTQINKWLRRIGHPTVKGYMILPSRERLVFFKEAPDQERKKQLGGNYVPVEVGSGKRLGAAIDRKSVV